MRSLTLVFTTTLCALVLSVGGCSKSSRGDSSQVVATVGGVELTAAQLDSRIKRLPPSVDTRDPQVLKAVLRNFVNESLLAQAAEKDKLDKKPAVARDIENSRDVVLANAYIDKNIHRTPISETLIQQFYNNNGSMFANRRIYSLTDVAVITSTPRSALIIAEMHRPGASIDSVLAVAKQNRIQVQTSDGQQSGDALPSQLSTGLASLAVGDNAVFQVAQTQHFARINNAVDSPVSYAQARQATEMLLSGEQREAALQAKLGQLRAETAIKYGEIGRKIQAETAKPSQPSAGPMPQETTRSNAIAQGAKGI